MKMKCVLGKAFLVVLLLFAVNMGFMTPTKKVEAATGKTYTITTKTKPVKNQYVKSKNYNAKTKHYYMLRSYMELLEKQGGGTLVLKKGVYNITNTICIPSNVTIKLSKGVVLKKLNSTGIKAMKASNTMFYLLPTSKQNKKNATSGYKGAKNISIIGEAGATIDMGGNSSSAIYMAHNNNILVQGITFKNVKGTTYIMTINGCKNIKIYNCNLSGQKTKTSGILIDIPAKAKKQTMNWVKQDDTVNQTIKVNNCNFTSLYRAITSVRFVKDKFSTKITLTNNQFNNIGGDVIRAINWDAPVIQNNVFNRAGTGDSIIQGKTDFVNGIYMGGVKNPFVSGNTFYAIPQPIIIYPYENTDPELKKANKKTNNTVTSAQLTQMYKENSCTNSVMPYIRYVNNSKAKSYIYYFFEEAKKTYTVTPDSLPYKLDYMVLSTYNEASRQYYMLQSYLNQIEANGGGTLVLTAGVYKLPAEVAVGSNTTIQFESGAYVQYTKDAGNKNFPYTSGMFALISPRGRTADNIYSGYSSAKNIKFIGPETKDGGIDSNGLFNIAVVMCHNSDVTFQNVHFKNHNYGHFIELDASYNVLVKDCVFEGYKVPNEGTNEAINLDIPDRTTQGFIRTWTSYDKTPNNTVVIENNVFRNLMSGVGSHHYTDGAWHTNVVIRNNSFDSIYYYPVRVMQMDAPVIEGNTFTKIGINRAEPTYIICMTGVKNPVAKGNVVRDSSAFIKIALLKDDNLSYPVLKNTVTLAQITEMRNQNTLINVDPKRMYVYYTNVLNPIGDQEILYRIGE